MDFFDEAARVRIQRRGISADQINDCLDNPDDRYIHRGDAVYCKRQEDQRLLKVTVRDQKVLNSFLVH